MSLAGDGLTDELYYLLWCKRDGRRGPAGTFLADTIIYKCGAPAAWYVVCSEPLIEAPASLHVHAMHNRVHARSGTSRPPPVAPSSARTSAT